MVLNKQAPSVVLMWCHKQALSVVLMWSVCDVDVSQASSVCDVDVVCL